MPAGCRYRTDSDRARNALDDEGISPRAQPAVAKLSHVVQVVCVDPKAAFGKMQNGQQPLPKKPTIFASLRIKEGPTLNKSLLGLGTLVKALADPNDSPFAEFGYCVLTTLLQVCLPRIAGTWPVASSHWSTRGMGSSPTPDADVSSVSARAWVCRRMHSEPSHATIVNTSMVSGPTFVGS